METLIKGLLREKRDIWSWTGYPAGHAALAASSCHALPVAFCPSQSPSSAHLEGPASSQSISAASLLPQFIFPGALPECQLVRGVSGPACLRRVWLSTHMCPAGALDTVTWQEKGISHTFHLQPTLFSLSLKAISFNLKNVLNIQKI